MGAFASAGLPGPAPRRARRVERLGRRHLIALVVVVALLIGASAAVSERFRDLITDPFSDAFVELTAPLAMLEPNAGQFGAGIDFVMTDGATVLALTAGSIELASTRPEDAGDAPFRMRVVGADPDVEPTASGEGTTTRNYLLGDDPTAWVTGVRPASLVQYSDVVPGVDLEYAVTKAGLRYDVIVDPGVDPSVVEFEFDGARSLAIDGSGRLVVGLPGGEELLFSAPFTYQETALGAIEVDSAYALDGHRVAFELGAYDDDLPIVIDPTLDLSTFAGGSGGDALHDVAVDASDNIYVVGETTSSNFATTSGSYDETSNGDEDVFVSKYSADGTTLLWSTFLGGSGAEQGYSLALAADGDVIVAGATDSANFPTTAGAYETTHVGNDDVWVAELSADGTTLNASTYIGEAEHETAWAVETTSTGDVVVGVTTRSADYPTTFGAYDTSKTGSSTVDDAAISVLDATLSTLEWSTFLGDTGDEQLHDLSVDANDDVYVVIGTYASAMPTTVGAFDTAHNGSGDVWVGRISSDGSALEYGTFIGGSGDDAESGAIVAESPTRIHVASSATTGYPTSANAHVASAVTSPDTGYVVLDLTQSGTSQLHYGTFLGGTDGGRVMDLALDSMGRAYIAGDVGAGGLATADAPDTTYSGSYDAALSVFDPDAGTLGLFTYLGGSGNDIASGVAVDGVDRPVLVGPTGSSDFATTVGAPDTTFAGSNEAFVVRYGAIVPAVAAASADQIVEVNSTADSADASPGDGLCDTGGTNADGADECTLRAAIAEANAEATIDTIHFAIPASDANHTAGVWTISPATELPAITAAATVDGTTQTGATAGTSTFPSNIDSSLAVELSGTALTGTDEDGLQLQSGSDGSTIRGMSITGFTATSNEAIVIWDSSNNVIAGNHIGVDAAGTAVGANRAAVYVGGTSNGNRIGGTAAPDRNLIAGNTNAGIGLDGTGVTDTLVLGNDLGLLGDGSAAGNGWYSVYVAGDGSATIGGTAAGAGNRIANGYGGIGPGVWGNPTASILGNSLWANSYVGIDLGGNGPTTNDGEDVDGGANDLLNFPVLTAPAGGDTTLDIDLDVPSGDYRIEVFTNPTTGAHSSGYGEGETLVHAQTVTATGAAGVESFTLTGIPAWSGGEVVTATATEDLGGGSYGATSEFSQPVSVPDTSVTVNSTGDAGDASAGDGACDTGGTNSEGTDECTLRAAIQEVDANGALDRIEFDVPASDPNESGGVWTISPGTALPTVSDAVVLDARTQAGWAGDPVVALDGALAAGASGIELGFGADGSTVAGFSVHGFDGDGIVLGSSDHAIVANWLGVDPSGTPDGNLDAGVYVWDGSNNTIGGVAATDANRMEANDSGVVLDTSAGSGTSILGNSITGNALIAIDLANEGVTPNDGDDVDTGPNDLLNFPVLTVPDEGTTTLGLDLDAPAADYRIEVFANPSEGADSSGFGEGEILVHAETVTHGGTGTESFTLTGLSAWSVGDVVTATATEDLGGGSYASTSEFSPAVTAAGTCVDSDGDGLCDDEEDANTDADVDPSTSPGPDTDGDTTPDYLDADDDGDGTPTASEDADANGDGDPRDALDSDHDGQPDYLDAPVTAPGWYVAGEQKISALSGDLTGPLDGDDLFGQGVAPIGDLDGDGVNDLAVGAYQDDDGDSANGAVYVLLLNADGTVKAEQKISALSGGLTGPLESGDQFGRDIASLGDVDGDGLGDLAVGAFRDDDGGSNRGAVYVLFMNADGTVKAEQKISDAAGGLTTALGDADEFGRDVAGLGDVDGDGVNDLAVGATSDDDGGGSRGAVYVLLLNSNGTVKAEQKISASSGGLTGPLDDGDQFGLGLAGLGDLDGDGVVDMVAGASKDADGGVSAGALYVLFLDSDGTVKAEQKISALSGGFGGIEGGDEFGYESSALGDLDGDGVVDLVVGAPYDDDGANWSGAVHVLFLNTDGTVKRARRISATSGGLTGPLESFDSFGVGVASLGDLDGDGTIHLAVGAHGDDDGADSAGAVYVLELVADPTVTVNSTGDASDSDPGDGFCDTGGANAAGADECTLRAAIAEANASAVVDTVTFDLPAGDPAHSGGVWTITPTSSVLPEVTGETILDATTQPGYAGVPVVVLDGSARSGDNDGLGVRGAGSIVRGWSVVNWPDDGVYSDADGVTFAANWFGVLPDGTTAANQMADLVVYGAASGAVVADSVFAAAGDEDGLLVVNAASSTLVEDNHFGVLPDGSALGAAAEAVVIGDDVDDTTIRTNVFGGLPNAAVYVGATGSTVIQGNWFGTDDTLVDTYPVDLALYVDGSGPVLFGGTSDGNGNVVRNAVGAAVAFAGNADDGSVIGNSIRSNGSIGIDLGFDGVTDNDVGDIDAGPNQLLNFPVLTTPPASATTLDVDLDVPAGDYRIEVFSNATDGADPSGHGEGESLIHAETVAHTGSGTESFTLTGLPAYQSGTVLTATATEDLGGGSHGSTSEFSVAVFDLTAVVNSTGDASDAIPGNGICDTGGANSEGADECTLRAAVQEADATSVGAIDFDIPTSDPGHAGGVWTIEPSTMLPWIDETVTIDATTQTGGNSGPVVVLDGSSATGGFVAGLGFTTNAHDSLVRGLSIHSFADDGISSDVDRLLVEDNHLGVLADGTTAPGSGAENISLWGGVDSIVRDNLIAGSTGVANVAVTGAGTSATIADNVIGTDVAGTLALGGGQGVWSDATGGVTITGNTIAHSDFQGVQVAGTASAVTILGNEIRDNGMIGIDLQAAGDSGDLVTANDPGDGDTGPNGLLNHPVLLAATQVDGGVVVDVELDAPAGDYRIELFANPAGTDPSGFGEGDELVGAGTFVHTGSGEERFSVRIGGEVGDDLTATATEDLGGGLYGATSEFSAAVTATADGGTVRDRSARRNDLTAVGGLDVTTPGLGVVADGIDLAAGTERLVGPATDVTTGALTLSGWIHADALASDSHLISKAPTGGGAIYELFVDGGTSEAVAQLSVGGSTVEVRGGSVGSGDWHQLAATWDGSTARLYVDGAEVDTAVASGSLAGDLSAPLVVGNTDRSGGGVDGTIDQIEVGLVARSADWIATAHQNAVNAAAMVSLGAVQTQSPGAWTSSSSVSRTGSHALEAPVNTGGGDGWVVATGVDEPGLVFEAWWRASDPGSSTLAAGTNTGRAPTDQRETATSGTSTDLGSIEGSTRTVDATDTATITPGTWTRIEIRTDETGRSSVWHDGVEIIGATLHGGGQTGGSAGLRVAELPNGETWYVDDVRIRRYVSDEPTTAVAPLDRR